MNVPPDGEHDIAAQADKELEEQAAFIARQQSWIRESEAMANSSSSCEPDPDGAVLDDLAEQEGMSEEMKLLTQERSYVFEVVGCLVLRDGPAPSAGHPPRRVAYPCSHRMPIQL